MAAKWAKWAKAAKVAKVAMGERLSMWYQEHLIDFEPARLADEQYRAQARVTTPRERRPRIDHAVECEPAPFATERAAAEHALQAAMQWVDRHGVRPDREDVESPPGRRTRARH